MKNLDRTAKKQTQNPKSSILQYRELNALNLLQYRTS